MSMNVLEETVQQTKDEGPVKGKSVSRFQTSKKDFQFETIPVRGYEYVVKIINNKTGLKAIVAIHNTTLGPALGGTRIRAYSDFDEALEDVLRLSKGMTYKSAITDVGLGGGKSVIIADPHKEKTPELLLSFAEALNILKGRYICAEDVGVTPEDTGIIMRKTKYVVGLPGKSGSGNPAPFTAWGTFRGIQSVIKYLYGTEDLEEKKVVIQGLGQVGLYLCHYLFWAGADLVVTDVHDEKVEKVKSLCGAEYVSPEEIYDVPCDVFAPCALGGTINANTITRLKCKAIAGCANNQLAKDEDAEFLRKRNILYAPDFVINAGGLLNVTSEIDVEGYTPKVPRLRTHRIFDRLISIYEIAKKNQISTHQAAISLADYRIKYGIGRRVQPPHFHHTTDL